MRHLATVLLFGVAIMTSSCHRGHPASATDCEAILDRLVDLELAQRGYADSALASRWHAMARARFSGDLASCRGRGLPSDALGCLARASSGEAAAHACFR